MRLLNALSGALSAVLVSGAVALASVYDYSTTAASNTTINGVAVPVGAMPPSNVGPVIRAMAAADAQWADDTGCATSTAGSANAYTFDALSNPYSGSATFADGDTFCFVASFTNTAAATLNVESEGAKAIRKLNDQALVGGEILQNAHYTVHYDASANSAAGAFILEGGGGDPTRAIQFACSDETSAITAGTSKVTFRMPYAFTVSGIRGSLSTTQGSGSIFTVDINESGTTILSTKLTIDNSETTSTTAATAAVISDTALADDAAITCDVDQIGNSTAKGVKITLLGVKNS